MATTLPCLDASWLERIRTGQLSNTEIDRVAAHLEECPACAARTQAIEEHNVLVEAARSGANRSDLKPQPVVLDLMRRLQELSVVSTSVGDGSTPHPLSESPERYLTKLLAPAQGPDELGRLGIYRVVGILGKGAWAWSSKRRTRS
jgi:hypothetical protein